MRTLNVSLLLILAVLVGAAATGIHFLHEWQLHRNAQFLLTLADRYEESDQPAQAVGSLRRYVVMVPDDTAALARLGLLQAKRHADAQAYVTLEQVLRREPTRDDIRRELVDVAMRIGRFTDARDHLEQYLLKTDRNDAQLLNLLGTCYDKLGDSAAAAKQFESAIEAHPESLESYVSLARLYTRSKEPDLAEKVLEGLVENNRGSDRAYSAYVARASLRYEQTTNPMSSAERDELLSRAEVDAANALAEDKDRPDGYLLAAELARARALAHPDDDEARDRAREYISQGLKSCENGSPEATKALPGFYRLLASLELDEGRRDLAIEALRLGVAKVQSPQDKATLRWTLAESLIDDGGLAEARTVIDGLRTEPAFASFVAYLDARVKLAEEQWQEGATELERLRPRLADVPELAKQVDFWLGRSYGMLGGEEQELTAYRRAVEADDRWVAAQCMLAGALAKAGRTHDAAEHYRRAMQLAGCPPEVSLELARLQTAETLRHPGPKQDWREIESLLAAAAKRMPDSVEVAVLQAQAEVARGAWDDARKRLAEVTRSHPDDANARLAGIALERLTRNWEEADRLLVSAREQLGDRVDLRLEQASVVEARDGAQGVSALLALAEPAAGLSADELNQLRIGLARHLQAVGATEQAKAMAGQVASDSADNLAVNLLLFDMAAAEQDKPAMDKWLQGIKRGNDPDASVLALYAESVRLVLEVEASKDRLSDVQRARLQKASDKLSEARGQRPGWPRLALLQARIEELRDKPALAIPWYQQAVDSGAGDDVVIHLIVLLADQKEYEQAEKLLRRLDEKQADLTPDVAPSAFNALSYRNDFVKALDLAYKACAASNDCEHHIWFGRIAAEVVLKGKLSDADEQKRWLAKAEQSFETAIRLDQHSVDAWFGLLNFYARTGRSQDVEGAIERARQQLAGPDLHRLLTRYYQSIDDVPTARRELELALAEHPDDAKTLRGAAEFHIMRRELDEARKLLEHLLEPQVNADPVDRAFARQSLAVLYLTNETYGSFLKAVEIAKGDDPNDPVSRRTTAILLARSPVGKDRREAIEILKDLQEKSLLGDADRFLLGQLYWRGRQHNEAMEVMEALLDKSPNNADYVAGYARMLLDDNRLEDAERWIKRLEGLAPQAVRTAELRARALASRRRESKAVSVLESLLTVQPAPGADAPQFDRGQLAVLLEGIANWKPAHGGPRAEEFLKAAERQFRQAEADSPSPERKAALAAFLGRHGKVKEGLQLCEELWASKELAAAAAGYMQLASRGGLSTAQLENIEREIEGALAEQPESIVLISTLGRVYRAQGKYDQVEATYRRLLAVNPNNVVALNNLAVLLTLRHTQGDEPRQLIDRAVELGGPGAALLDSRAMVELAAGETGKAIRDLEEATTDEPTPEYLFHLAQAHLQRNEIGAATQAIETAKSLGLEEESLHPLERDAYQQVLAVLPQAPGE
ncbi:MAG TPA: tetratricopeptide repeat protein [Pirellulales bacterium]|nr:tetratricopeptide repeat protein [Pirellulales bacterium]